MKNLDYSSLDLSRPGVDVHGDMERLPLRSSSIDLVISSHVLEHVNNDRSAMREICRVLDPATGSALILVPVDYSKEATSEDWTIDTPEARAAAFGQADHVRQFGRDIAERLAESGLEVEEIDFVESLTDSDRDLIRAEPGIDMIYVCHHPRSRSVLPSR